MTIKLGLVGTGIFAKDAHYPAISSTEGLEVTGVFNRTKAKAEAFVEDVGLKSAELFESLDEIFASDKVDAVDSLLPTKLTLSAVQKAIEVNKPLCFEKPIAANIKDAKEIVKLTDSTEIPIMVLENYLYRKDLALVEKHLPSIGKVVTFNYHYTGPFAPSKYHNTAWRATPEHVGGYLSDGGVHQLGLLTELLGEVESVSARTTQLQHVSGADDTLNALFSMRDGSFGTFLYGSGFGATHKVFRFTILGTEGSIVLEQIAGETDHTVTVFNGTDKSSTKKNVYTVEAETNGVPEEFANFKEAVLKKDKSVIVATPRKTFHHFAIVVAAVESASKGGELVSVETV